MINFRSIKAIYIFEMSRTFRTIIQSLISPILSTVLYFIVFGTAIGNNINFTNEIPYGAFIVPGLVILTISMQSVTNASFGIFFQNFLEQHMRFYLPQFHILRLLLVMLGPLLQNLFV